jgi:hypothetical protein
MKHFLFLLPLCFAFSAFGQFGGTKDTVLHLAGKVIKEEFVSKSMKKTEGVYDYYFRSGTEKYFIKTYKTKFTKEDLDKWVNVAATIKAVVENGNWDDNGEGQSRVGQYIVIKEISGFKYPRK